MIDDEYFEWRDAVLLAPGVPAVDHRVPLVNGRPPGEFRRPRGDGSYSLFRLTQNDDTCAVYELVGQADDD